MDNLRRREYEEKENEDKHNMETFNTSGGQVDVIAGLVNGTLMEGLGHFTRVDKT
jgi:hypothetical protein